MLPVHNSKHIEMFTLYYIFMLTPVFGCCKPSSWIPLAAFHPFFHPQTAPKSAFLEKLILRTIIKVTTTKCNILKLKCTKFDFGSGTAPDPAGELKRSPDPLAGFKGPTSKGRVEEVRGRERGREGGEVIHTQLAIKTSCMIFWNL